MATGTIKNQPTIKKVKNVSISFTNGVATYTDSDIKATSLVYAIRIINANSSVMISAIYVYDGYVKLYVPTQITYTSDYDLLIVN